MNFKTISNITLALSFFIGQVFAPTISPEDQWKGSLRRDTYIPTGTSARPAKPSQAGQVRRGLLPEQIQRHRSDRLAQQLIDLVRQSFDQAYAQYERPAKPKVAAAQVRFASSSESGVASKSQTHTPSTTLTSTRSVVIAPEVTVAPQETPREPSRSRQRSSTEATTLTTRSSGGFLAQEPQRAAASASRAPQSISSFSVQLTDLRN